MAKTKQQKSLTRWTKQKWTTASGKKSSETGEVYAPKKTIATILSSDTLIILIFFSNLDSSTTISSDSCAI